MFGDPGLVRAEGHRDGGHGHPQAPGAGSEDDGAQAEGGEKHRDEARLDGRRTARDEVRGQTSARDPSQVRAQINDDERKADLVEADAELVLPVQKRGKPEQIEPEHGHGQRVGDGESPGDAKTDHARVRKGRRLGLRFLAHVRQFLPAHVRMVLGVVVASQPDREPEEAERRSCEERRLPAPGMEQGRQDRGREHRAHRGPRVEDAGGESALSRRKPQARGLDAGREVRGFRDSEKEAADHEAPGRGRETVGRGREAPETNGERQRALHPDPVDEPPLGYESDGVADLEPEVDVGVVEGGPAHRPRQDGLEDAERGAVDVVDGGGEEEEGHHGPAHRANANGLSRPESGSAYAERRIDRILPASVFPLRRLSERGPSSRPSCGPFAGSLRLEFPVSPP